ncbi:hypothetical protein CGRA01v4_09858 [Colletotrichum graminicola]|nr:hypothetical protein CGRA01v4_09858 [Colletotrichum graminicola]
MCASLSNRISIMSTCPSSAICRGALPSTSDEDSLFFRLDGALCICEGPIAKQIRPMARSHSGNYAHLFVIADAVSHAFSRKNTNRGSKRQEYWIKTCAVCARFINQVQNGEIGEVQRI